MGEAINIMADNPAAAGWVVAALLIMVLNHLLGASIKLGVEWFNHRKGNGMQGTIKANTAALKEVRSVMADIAELDPPPYPQCHYAPDHFDQVEATHSATLKILKMQETQKEQIDQGLFGCRVRGSHLETIQRIRHKLDEGKVIG